MKNTHDYDSTFKTLKNRHARLFIAVINLAFHKNYPLDAEVRIISSEGSFIDESKMPFTLHLPSKNSLNIHNYRNVFSSEMSTCSSLRKHCYTNASQIFPNPYFCVLSEVRKRKINIIY